MSALLADRDRAATEDPPIAVPDAIVVSGDLVQGARLGANDYATVLTSQYQVAADFLCRLADEFLGGDRRRLVVVPGNHDVDWNTAFAAMTVVADADLPSNFSEGLCGPTADLRWRWSERQAYRITDRAAYDQRLAGFSALVADFYRDTHGVTHAEDFRIHDLLGGRIGVVAFDSCVGNDCFAHHGAIRHEAVARAHLSLRDRGHELLMAVWHHSIDGEPAASDYMAVSTVHRMIGVGFRIGLHGHQHRAEAALRYVNLPQQEQMAVVSAGSLCAGGRELPTGVNRQYNIIEISDDLAGARVHVREMAIATSFAAARRAEFGGNSWMDMEWDLSTTAAEAAGIRRKNLVTAAEASLAAGDAAAALASLDEIPTDATGYARALRLEALRRLERWQGIVDAFSGPRNLDELTAVATALATLGDVDGALSVLDMQAPALGMPEPNVFDLKNAIRAIGNFS